MEEIDRVEIEEIEEIKKELIALHQKMDEMNLILKRIYGNTKPNTFDFGPH